jgi:Choice-of-anchor I domain
MVRTKGYPFPICTHHSARSFPIRTSTGKLVFDSGDDFERITAAAFPANFNASNTSNTFDNRSDDKGPESEGVVLEKSGHHTYAFISLERIGGIMVYDITNPFEARFIQYINSRFCR